tara:strand:+ start:938 stop:2563 length:1626 start_codon:yes stop_codon:yes gene_type:complete
MVSPDWSTYVDLTPFDTTVSSILEESLTQAKALLPQWTPRVGQIETTLMEATAYQTANLANAANRLPGSTVETLLKLYGITRSDGVKATSTVNITFTDSLGHTIPAATPFAYIPSSGTTYVYMLDADATVASGSSSLSAVAVTAQAVGIGHNTPSNGSSLQILATIPYVQTVTLAAKPLGGLDAETDSVYFTRAINTLSGYSSTLATETQLRSYVLATYGASVFRAKAYNMRRYADRNVVTSGNAAAGTHSGYVLLSVAGENTNGYNRSIEDATVSAADVSTISTDVAGRIQSGLIVEVHNAELVGVGVTCEVFKTTAAASGTVNGLVQTALEGYLDSDAWDWDRVVRVNEVISLLDNVTGVDYVKSVVLSLPEETVVGATTANLTATYANGTLGVGATLTNSSTQAAFAIDGLTPSLESRILVKDQSTAAQNGIYEVTVVGDGSTNWVLTRVTTADTLNEMVVDRFVWVVGGSANASKGFSCSASGTIGTDGITFVQTSTAQRVEVRASNDTASGALTGDILMSHLGILTYPSTLTITVS